MTTPAGPTESAARVLGATLAALAVAGIILLIAVWPGIYGVSPLPRQADGARSGPATDAAAVEPGAQQVGPVASEPAFDDGLAAIIEGNVRPADPGSHTSYPAAFKSEVIRIPLQSLEEVEYKAHMQAGDTVIYSWSSPQPLYVDFHGEPYTYPDDPVVRYREVDGADSGHGRVTASFPGMHGWFWLNTSDEAVVVELKVAGFYDRMEEVHRSLP